MTDSPDLARAFWLAEPGRGGVRAEPLPAPAAGDAVVRTLFSGVSRGTKALVYLGKVPASEQARSTAFSSSRTLPGQG